MEFNTRTKTGTFYNASGIASLEGRGMDRSFFGTQEPDAYFWGETIEKLGPKTYRISHGGFTTCVQPTPRWELVSNAVTLTLEKRAFIKNAVLKVKDVPVFYLPAMYYPINKEDRATGFLIPIYGSSDDQGADAQQRLLLGDQPEPGRDALPQLVFEDRPELRRRVPLRAVAGLDRATSSRRS